MLHPHLTSPIPYLNWTGRPLEVSTKPHRKSQGSLNVTNTFFLFSFFFFLSFNSVCGGDFWVFTMAKKPSMFSDPIVEIQELMMVVKNNIIVMALNLTLSDSQTIQNMENLYLFIPMLSAMTWKANSWVPLSNSKMSSLNFLNMGLRREND